jgi:hypothetical protein
MLGFSDNISNEEPPNKEALVVTTISIFFHFYITMLPLENVMNGLAYTIDLTPTYVFSLFYHNVTP